MASLSIQLKRCLLNSRPHPNAGFTLVELITAIALAAIMLGFAVQLIVDQRRQFVSDRARADVSQTLRSAMDLVGNDIRQAGQYVNDNYLPVVSVRDNSAPTPGQILTVQQKLTGVQLFLCKPITVSSQLVVADITTTDPKCGTPKLVDYGSVNPKLGDYGKWRNFRCNQDEDNYTPCTRTTALSNASSCAQNGGSDNGCVWAYIYDPNLPNRRGDFFLTDFEQQTGTTFVLNRLDGPGWASGNTYQIINPSSPPIIYVLQENEYQLETDSQTARGDDYVLNLVTNRQTNNKQRLVNGLENFEVQVQLPASLASLPFNFSGSNPTYLNDWRPIQQIELTMKAVNSPNTPSNQANPSGIKLPEASLELKSQFLPRNALSIPSVPSP
jgi:prepilin-type N-terminal cleavage/methylation domain-containing protein